MTVPPTSGSSHVRPEQSAAPAEAHGADDRDVPASIGEQEQSVPRTDTSQDRLRADQATDAADDTLCLGLSQRDRLLVGSLCALLLVLMVVHWGRLSGWGMRPIEVEHAQPRSFDYKIDINRANWVQWAQLEGVGEVLAERIVADREQNGPFQSIDDLRRVKGVGEKTLAKIRPWLKVGAD